MQKSFPITSYNKHFSSIGKQRSAVSTSDRFERKEFKTQTKEYPAIKYDMAQFNDRLMQLEQDAGIKTSQKVRKVAERQMYQAMSQDTKRHYAELAEELSLRDVNRFAFRRNRASEKVPVTKAASE